MDKGKSKRVAIGENGNTHSSIQVLLCDTNAETCQQACTLLRQCSYQVTQVNSAASMKEALELEGPYTDVILAEANVLLSNGAKMIKSIQRNKKWQHIPIIMMLSENEISLTYNGLGLGATDYLIKPLGTNELLSLWTYVRANHRDFI